MNSEEMRRRMFRELAEAGKYRLRAFTAGSAFERYRQKPGQFAARVLGSKWWSAQETVGRMVAENRRVVVRSGNGVGKTHLAADLALWFLYTHRPAIVLVTAPTWRQAKEVLWAEIQRRFIAAKGQLPGRMLQTKLDLGGGSMAMPLTAERADAFQGFHGPNLLVILDEASGVKPEIWEAADGIAVSSNNKVLAMGNPLSCTGRFYEAFRKASGWQRASISAMEHPNVTGRGRTIPGCVNRVVIEERVAEWCEADDEVMRSGDDEVMRSGDDEVMRSGGDPVMRSGGDEESPPHIITSSPDHFLWEGRVYLPTDVFRTRVLGEFPRAEEYGLIPVAWVEAAMSRELAAEGDVRMAADVARFGADWTVIGVRRGPVLVELQAIRGSDTMAVVAEIERKAYAFHPGSIGIDGIGVGAGVVDRLVEMGIDGVESMNSCESAHQRERYANRRAELYWGLRERFRKGEIALREDSVLLEELVSLRYRLNSMGRIQIEGKEEIRKRIGRSPDRADMLAMLYDSSYENAGPAVDATRSPAALLRAEMEGW